MTTTSSGAEALPVFNRVDERLDHLSVLKVPVELIQLGEPEVIAGVINVLRIVGIAPQVTKELHQDKCAVELSGQTERIKSN